MLMRKAGSGREFLKWEIGKSALRIGTFLGLAGKRRVVKPQAQPDNSQQVKLGAQSFWLGSVDPADEMEL